MQTAVRQLIGVAGNDICRKCFKKPIVPQLALVRFLIQVSDPICTLSLYSWVNKSIYNCHLCMITKSVCDDFIECAVKANVHHAESTKWCVLSGLLFFGTVYYRLYVLYVYPVTITLNCSEI